MKSKSLAPLRILEILHDHTDADHPLTQEEIIAYLDDFDISLERKAVSRHISSLKEAGYDIASNSKGVYLETRPFEDAELRLLIDGVLSSRYIPSDHSKDLIDRLSKLGNRHFKTHITHVHTLKDWSKTENKELFLSVEVIDEAIEKKCRIAFDFYKYNAHKKLEKTSSQEVSPYQLLLHNQRYYLMAHNEYWKNMSFYRLDRIKDVDLLEEKPATPLRSLPSYEGGIDYKDLSSSRPYMYSDKAERICFLTGEGMVDQLIDWFGDDFHVRPCDQDKGQIEVSLRASPQAMVHWAMQYANFVEILSPASLRDQVKENLEAALKMYRSSSDET